MTTSHPHRVLMLEINEISWELMQPWLKSGELRHFQKLRSNGTWGRTIADEKPGNLDPWITWTTLYTGVPQEEHGLVFLEQPPETIRYKRLWDLVADAGGSVGVFGSASSWPPRKVDGFFIPGAFSPDSQTYPEDLRPIQDLNLRHTHAHAPGARQEGLGGMAKSAARLVKHGLNARTMAAIARVLAEIKLHPDRDWKKVSLQPRVNLPFFTKLYRKYEPRFATFHTNHVAHYQHRFFRAWQPERFPDPTDPQEINRFNDAIHYGYRVADWLVGRFMALCDQRDDVILCVASSMGQKPWIPERFDKVAPVTCRLRSVERLEEILGLKGRCEHFSTMAPQWNLRIKDDGLRRSTIEVLHRARYEPLDKPMYHAVEVKDTIVLTPVSHHGVNPSVKCRFKALPGEPTFPFSELVIQEDDTRKSGCHDPIGLLAFYGRHVRTGTLSRDVNNLDVAPTLLTLLGMPVPSYMRGKPFAGEVVQC